MRQIIGSKSIGTDDQQNNILIAQFVCDTIADLPTPTTYSNLKVKLTIGTTAKVIDPKSSYKMKSDGTWIIQDVGNDTYSKSEIDDLLDDKADKSTTYTKTETDAEIQGAITDLDVPSTPLTGHYITSIEQVDGLINASYQTYATTVVPSSTKLITSGGVSDAISTLRNEIFGRGTAVENNTDILTLGIGRYYRSSATNISTLTNLPDNYANVFSLEIKNTILSSRRIAIFQPCTSASANVFYTNIETSSGWAGWVKYEGTVI